MHDPVSCRNPQDRSRKRAAVELPPRPFGASGGGDTDSSARAVTCSSSRHRLAGVCDRRREATEQRAQIILGWKARGSGELAWKRARLPLLSAYDQSAVDDHRTVTSHGATRDRRGRPWPGGTYAAAPKTSPASEVLGLCAKDLDSSCEESASPLVRPHDGSAAPATTPGANEVQLELGSNSARPSAVTGARMTTFRARYRSHSSFVGEKDKHLDEISGHEIPYNLTPRLRLARRQRAGKGEVARVPRRGASPDRIGRLRAQGSVSDPSKPMDRSFTNVQGRKVVGVRSGPSCTWGHGRPTL